MLHFFWATGVRRAELINLQLAGLDLGKRRATVVGKGNIPRGVFFDEACRDDLERWLLQRGTWETHCDNVFVAVSGTPFNPRSVLDIVHQAAQRAGLRKELWTHVFRHSRITELLNRGMKLQEVANFAGHSNVNTTMHYFHAEEEQLQKSYDEATRPRRRRSRPEKAEE